MLLLPLWEQLAGREVHRPHYITEYTTCNLVLLLRYTLAVFKRREHITHKKTPKMHISDIHNITLCSKVKFSNESQQTLRFHKTFLLTYVTSVCKRTATASLSKTNMRPTYIGAFL
jgi:hypothetical protein